MDPLAAISLATAVVQFLDFGAKVFRASQDIVGDGSTVSNSEIKALSRDLSSISASLAGKIATRTSSQLSKEEEGFCELARQCIQVADELADYLDKLSSKSKDRQVWKSIRAALLSVWNEEHIEKLARRLQDYRSQLTLRLLSILNSRSHAQDEKLNLLADASKDIVEVISVNYEGLAADMNRQHAETIAAIFTTQGGITSAIASRPGGIAVPGTESSTVSTTFSLDSGSFATRTTVNHIQRVLDSLHFRGITERRSAISDAHIKTFQWVWAEAESGQTARWDNLKTWLESGSGCYWLAGKAGSGKSSLMKYLQSSPQTEEALKRWAGTSEVITGSFYFWYAGNHLQKSQTGLLRSLLLNVLSSRPDLCVVLFPDICRSIFAGKVVTAFLTLTNTELSSAFARLTSLDLPGTKFFFLVDGLDEYSGDHNEICDLFSRAAGSPHIKFLVSSRPLPAFFEKLSTFPKLFLQDLTWDDIYRYANDKLRSNTVLQKMEVSDPDVTAQLVSGICSKACGVFLWVVLVVQRLTISLQNYDTRKELEAEMEKLPSDLESLYDHMLGSQSKHHQILGSKYFQLALRSMDIGLDLCLLQLSFCGEDDYTKALSSPIREMPSQDSRWICEATEGRLRSRCCGLLETQDSIEVYRPRWDKKVTFFHRTVVEFLQLDAVWKKLRSLTPTEEFDAHTALISYAVAEFKLAPTDNLMSSQAISALMARILIYGKEIKDDTEAAFHNLYLPESHRVLHFYCHNSSIFTSPDEQFKSAQVSMQRSAVVSAMPYPYNLLFMVSCLVHKLGKNSGETLAKRCAKFGWHLDYSRHIKSAHVIMHFVDERDARIRQSMSSHALLSRDIYCRKKDIPSADINLWNSRWADISSNPSSLTSISLWEYLLHYIFVITSLPERVEARDVMSDPHMMLSLLDIILVMFHEMEFYDPVRYVIQVKQRGGEVVLDVALLSRLSCIFWTKATTAPDLFDPRTFATLAKRLWQIESFLISRTISDSMEFKSTAWRLLGGEKLAPEKKTTLKKPLGFWDKFRVSSDREREASAKEEQPSVTVVYVDSPWKKYAERMD